MTQELDYDSLTDDERLAFASMQIADGHEVSCAAIAAGDCTCKRRTSQPKGDK